MISAELLFDLLKRRANIGPGVVGLVVDFETAVCIHDTLLREVVTDKGPNCGMVNAFHGVVPFKRSSEIPREYFQLRGKIEGPWPDPFILWGILDGDALYVCDHPIIAANRFCFIVQAPTRTILFDRNGELLGLVSSRNDDRSNLKEGRQL